MACSSCAKRRQEMRNAVASSSNRFQGRGLFSSNPIILGNSVDGMITYRVRVARPTTVGGLSFSVNEAFFVTGDFVQEHIDNGNFIDITNRTASGRVYNVGSSIYTSLSDATVASQATGLPIVEVG